MDVKEVHVSQAENGCSVTVTCEGTNKYNERSYETKQFVTKKNITKVIEALELEEAVEQAQQEQKKFNAESFLTKAG